MATVNEEIKRIKDAKAAIKTSIENKGVVVPAEAHIEEYAAKIDAIQTSGGEPILYLKDFPDLRLGCFMGERVPDNIILDGITSAERLFGEADHLLEVPSFDSSKCTNMYQMTSWADKIKKVNRLDISNVTNMSEAFSASNINEIYLAGGINPKCNNVPNPFPNTGSNSGIFFFELPGDYSKALNYMRKNWKTQPLGVVPLKMRILKDTAWLSGEQNITLNGNKLTYAGKGLYEVNQELSKENYLTTSKELQQDGAKIADTEWTIDEQIIMSGDNSSIHKEYAGEAIMNIVTQNDNWTYKPEYGGIVSKDINDGENTSITISVSGLFTIEYGQKSESGYDFCEAFNAAGVKIWDAKGVSTEISGSKTEELKTDTSVTFKYHKDSSGTTEPDCFWLKKISFTNFPPYPEV